MALAASLACAPKRAALPSSETGSSRLTYLALGDSYTIGESVAPEERWPVQLAALLSERGFAVGAPVIVAKTGWTTDELSHAIDSVRVSGTYSLVSLLIGVNNQYRGRDLEQYRGQFRDLLRRAIGFAGEKPGHVVVLSIPDWGVTPFAVGRDRAKIGSEIDRFNAVNREETGRAGARYVDVTPISREAASDSTMFAGDGLHPSGKQYAAWARQAVPASSEALATKAKNGAGIKPWENRRWQRR